MNELLQKIEDLEFLRYAEQDAILTASWYKEDGVSVDEQNMTSSQFILFTSILDSV